ncbi:hypothetical protein E2562_006484 [Oryza meyeriana var. granulata]|uniref:Uncharacterized protein n=1 Tax=Oryza meyeriana var. granulata TaxID=110450 RepID=A0A6G1CNX9_9ORYZ|nr:hypothetical protein E2562_006484 [Oryza meyeriana var. granulata]
MRESRESKKGRGTVRHGKASIEVIGQGFTGELTGESKEWNGGMGGMPVWGNGGIRGSGVLESAWHHGLGGTVARSGWWAERGKDGDRGGGVRPRKAEARFTLSRYSLVTG